MIRRYLNVVRGEENDAEHMEIEGSLLLSLEQMKRLVASGFVKVIGGHRISQIWLYNNGTARETTGSGYLRNKARKEYLVGDASDPKWGQFANSYVFCVANHELWPTPGSIAYVEEVNTYDELPTSVDGRNPIDKYNFTFALLTMYYLSRPASTSSVYPPTQWCSARPSSCNSAVLLAATTSRFSSCQFARRILFHIFSKSAAFLASSASFFLRNPSQAKTCLSVIWAFLF